MKQNKVPSTYKSKYLLCSAVLFISVLCINLAQADDWLYTKCSKSKVVDNGVPEYFTVLAEFHWGVSLTKQSYELSGNPVIQGNDNIYTNLGVIDKISLDKDDNMVYPITGNNFSGKELLGLLEPDVHFKIEMSKKDREYAIKFTSNYIINNKKVTATSSLLLSDCKTEACKCRGTPEQKTYQPTPPSQRIINHTDLEEISTTTGVCSCTLL